MRTMVATTMLVVMMGCTSRVPGLSESRARALLQAALLTGNHPVSQDRVAPVMKRSPIDYRATTATTGPPWILKRLLSEGLVTQTIELLRYPDVSSTWVGRVDHRDGRGFNAKTIRIWMAPDSNSLAGNCQVLNHRDGSDDNLIDLADVRGTVSPDGTVDLSGSVYCLYKGQAHLLLKEERTTARLQNEDMPAEGLTGRTTGTKVERTWYDYQFNPAEVTLLANGRIAGGPYELQTVSNLRLLNENTALATFAWHASLNRIGRIMLGNVDPTGIGTAEFARQPDGTWILVKPATHKK